MNKQNNIINIEICSDINIDPLEEKEIEEEYFCNNDYQLNASNDSEHELYQKYLINSSQVKDIELISESQLNKISIFPLESFHQGKTKHKKKRIKKNKINLHKCCESVKIDNAPIMSPIKSKIIKQNSHGDDAQMIERVKINTTPHRIEILIDIFIILPFCFLFFQNMFICNILAIDGIFSSIFFYSSYVGHQIKHLIERLTICERYVYYSIILSIVLIFHICTWFTWFHHVNVLLFFASPSLMKLIHKNHIYRKINVIVQKNIKFSVKKIICYQLSKIINNSIKNILKIDLSITHEELYQHYDNIDLMMISRFFGQFCLALVFNYFDKKRFNVPFILLKNIYMKDSSYNIGDDNKYFQLVIADRRWDMFLDVYSLNRLIRIIMKNDSKNNYIINKFINVTSEILFIINKLFFCWTVASIATIEIGILSMILFIGSSQTKLFYLLSLTIFAFLGKFIGSVIITFISMEIFLMFYKSNILSHITNNIFITIGKITSFIIENTDVHTYFISCIFSLVSFVNVAVLKYLCILSMIILICSYVFEMKYDCKNIFQIFQIKSSITILSIFVIGSLSSYFPLHILFIPIIIQNIYDRII
jgi:hypothetical protein